jgi:hypothetical protein
MCSNILCFARRFEALEGYFDTCISSHLQGEISVLYPKKYRKAQAEVRMAAALLPPAFTPYSEEIYDMPGYALRGSPAQ